MKSSTIKHTLLFDHLSDVPFPVRLVFLQPFVERTRSSFQQGINFCQLAVRFIHFLLLGFQFTVTFSQNFSLALFELCLQLVDSSLSRRYTSFQFRFAQRQLTHTLPQRVAFILVRGAILQFQQFLFKLRPVTL